MKVIIKPIICKKYKLIWCFLLLVQFVSSQNVKPDIPRFLKNTNSLDSTINDLLKKWNTPGCGVAIVYRDQLLYAKGYGYRNISKKLPVTTNTLFQLGSNTKLFTATAIGMLVEHNKLKWDEPIRKYVPSIQFPTNELNDNVSIRDMLSHRVGFTRHDQLCWDSDLTLEQVTGKVKFLNPTFALRQRWQYNNIMYKVAGYSIEQLSGKTWSDFMKDQFLIPLSMNHTVLTIDDMILQKDYMQSYYESDSNGVLLPFSFPLGRSEGSTGIITDLIDYSHWLIAQMNHGLYTGKQVIPKKVIEETMAPVIPVYNSDLLDFGYTELLNPEYCMGRWAVSYRGHYLTYHTGNTKAIYSEFSFMPYDSIGVIVYINGRHAYDLVRVITYAIYDRLLGLEPVLWSNRYLPNSQKAQKNLIDTIKRIIEKKYPASRASCGLSAYAGDYINPAYDTLHISIVNGLLYMKYHYVILPLHRIYNDTFQSDYDIKSSLLALELSGLYTINFTVTNTDKVPQAKMGLDNEEVIFNKSEAQ